MGGNARYRLIDRDGGDHGLENFASGTTLSTADSNSPRAVRRRKSLPARHRRHRGSSAPAGRRRPTAPGRQLSSSSAVGRSTCRLVMKLSTVSVSSLTSTRIRSIASPTSSFMLDIIGSSSGHRGHQAAMKLTHSGLPLLAAVSNSPPDSPGRTKSGACWPISVPMGTTDPPALGDGEWLPAMADGSGVRLGDGVTIAAGVEVGGRLTTIGGWLFRPIRIAPSAVAPTSSATKKPSTAGTRACGRNSTTASH